MTTAAAAAARRAHTRAAQTWGAWLAAHPRPADAATAALLAARGAPHDAALLTHAPTPTPDERTVAEAVQYAVAPGDPRAQRENRQRTGAFYTPPPTAEALAALAIDGARAAPPTVLDPACGAGALLVAALERLIALYPAHPPAVLARGLFGFDTDPTACAAARARIAGRIGADPAALAEQIRCGDGLRAALPAVDIVVMNPPYGSAIKQTTRRGDAERRDLAARFPLAARRAFDRAALFVELAHRCAAPSGAVAAVLPQAFAVTPAAGELRAALAAQRAQPRIDPLPAHALGDAQVRAALFVWSAAASTHAAHTPTPTTPTASPLGDDPRFAALPLDRPLGEWLEIRASATVSEAYAIRDHIEEGGHGLRFVTAGAIEPHRIDWGTRPQRYLGRALRCPTVAAERLPVARQAQAARDRVLVAALSRELEAVAVGADQYAGAVSTLCVWPRPAYAHVAVGDIAALLNHTHVRALYRARWGAAALAGASVPVTRARLAAIVPGEAV